jgi:hypothetical protein
MVSHQRSSRPAASLTSFARELVEGTARTLLRWIALAWDTAIGQSCPVTEPAAAPGSAEPDRPPAREARPSEEAPRSTVEHIPWGYGRDRVTAIAVDGDRLYVYWEVTDPALARAQARLAGDPYPSLRVYDVTGRIFDGTNAHGHFDHRIGRDDRQWFFHVGRPGSTVVVEIGCASGDGSFVRIARSRRVDFPRREMRPPGPSEWLTVRGGAVVARTRSPEGDGARPAVERMAGAAADARSGDGELAGLATPATPGSIGRRGEGSSDSARVGGASERRLGGGSDERLGGSGAGRLGHASEERLGGASENVEQRSKAGSA